MTDHEKGLEAAHLVILKSIGFRFGTDTAKEAIRAYLDASGMVLVPRDPTEEMEDAGADAYHSTKEELILSRRASRKSDTVFPSDWLAATYRSMVSAVPNPFERKQDE